MLAKQDHGCRFFITQSVYDAGSTKSLLSDYAWSLRTSGRSPIPVVLTFSPCGSVRTLEFMKWLGISFPRWLENELRHSADTLERSVDLCERVFTDVQDYAREKGLPITPVRHNICAIGSARQSDCHPGGDLAWPSCPTTRSPDVTSGD
jgi:5,10-methylenetetrahydrofolate reductase